MQLTSIVAMLALLCVPLHAKPSLPFHQTPFLSSNPNKLNFILKAFKKASIIDDVVDEFTPKCYLAPFYGKKQHPVTLGNAIKPSKTQVMPSLSIYCPDPIDVKGLTIVLTDPDAPSRDDPKWAEMCHWIAKIPITPNENIEAITEKVDVDEVVHYKAPGPPPKTGWHRYVFLFLEGDNSNVTAPNDRQHWGTGEKGHGVRDWAGKEKLTIVGGNFFYARNKQQ